VQRRNDSSLPDAHEDIYFQIWAKPLPDGAMAVLAINNQAGANFKARVEFSAVRGMDVDKRYKVRDLYIKVSNPTECRV
jgi:hypothetical protein